jgi:hypothetical protein
VGWAPRTAPFTHRGAGYVGFFRANRTQPDGTTVEYEIFQHSVPLLRGTWLIRKNDKAAGTSVTRRFYKHYPPKSEGARSTAYAPAMPDSRFLFDGNKPIGIKPVPAFF